MVQYEADRAFDDLEHVKKRLELLAEKQPVAVRRTYREFVEIIDAAMLAAAECGSDPELTFPEEKYKRD